jgi:hypothetical protein
MTIVLSRMPRARARRSACRPGRRCAPGNRRRPPSGAPGRHARPVRNVLPRGHAFRARAVAACRPGSSPWPSAARRRAPGRRPSRRRTCPCTCRPIPGHVMGTVHGAGRPPHQERAIGIHGEVAAHPGDRLVRHGLGQVEVLVVLHVRHRDRGGVLPQGGLPLRGLPGDEAVEIVEAPPGRRAVVGAVGDLLDRRVVVLAEGRRGVAVVAAAPRRWLPTTSG